MTKYPKYPDSCICWASHPVHSTQTVQAVLAWPCTLDGYISKDIINGELASGKRSIGCPRLHYKDIFKHDMKALDINKESWEDLSADWNGYHSVLRRPLRMGEKKPQNKTKEKRA